MSYFILNIFLLFSQLQTQAIAPLYSKTSACAQAQDNFQKRFDRLQKKYLSYSDKVVSTENKPTWTWGRKKQAIYLLHGFIGTPEEMTGIAAQLAENNYTVINDIIPGYAADGQTANQFNQETWQNHVEANLNSIRSCFEKIHLIGFSTGGLLLHNYIRHHNDFTAQSLTLYSPFYKPHLSFGDFLRSAARLFTATVSTKTLYSLTHFPDIKVAVLKPENYLRELPLDAAGYVAEFGEYVSKQIKSNPLLNEDTPVLLFLAQADQVINLNETIRAVDSDFANVTIQIFKQNTVHHHLMVKGFSPVAQDVYQRTIDFISRAR
jgi:pimeloyl-ACP methyl ester carboxylesterase